MSMLDEHAAALANVDEVYHNFLLRYKGGERVVYGVVEGKDDPSFYRSMIERFIPDEWKIDILISGNKRKSIAAFNSFDWTRFDKRRIAFFLDRDTDEFVKAIRLQSSNVYYTDGYAIENSFVTSDVYMRLLTEVYGVIDASIEEERVLHENFNKDLSSFLNFMKPLMAQIISWRMNGSTAYLNDPDIGELFIFRDGEIQVRACAHTPDLLVAKVGNMIGAIPSSREERIRLEGVIDQFDDRHLLIRGKYLLWFLGTILNYTHSNIPSLVQAYNRPPRGRQQLGPKTVGLAAAPRARIPTSLRAFLEQTYLAFIGEQPAMIH